MQNFNPQFAKIGDILVHNNVIDESQLNQALSEQNNSNEKLGTVLIKLGFINEQNLLDAYSQQMGYKTINLEEILQADLDVTSTITEDFAKENNVIPYKKNETNIIEFKTGQENENHHFQLRE